MHDFLQRFHDLFSFPWISYNLESLRPGVGKTTVMREIARVLSDELHKRVVIVDTSNEIGGDGNVPHAAIGNARRMQTDKSVDMLLGGKCSQVERAGVFKYMPTRWHIPVTLACR
ncbi:hypothetical protein Fmac_002682 [Flemingia macrophylla]|uniref:Uncharacterized protein n=1 Tax=Flemingia macrophylla TaxID=520843 RepID=A0ABD1NKN7_9FABA